MSYYRRFIPSILIGAGVLTGIITYMGSSPSAPHGVSSGEAVAQTHDKAAREVKTGTGFTPAKEEFALPPGYKVETYDITGVGPLPHQRQLFTRVCSMEYYCPPPEIKTAAPVMAKAAPAETKAAQMMRLRGEIREHLEAETLSGWLEQQTDIPAAVAAIKDMARTLIRKGDVQNLSMLNLDISAADAVYAGHGLDRRTIPAMVGRLESYEQRRFLRREFVAFWREYDTARREARRDGDVEAAAAYLAARDELEPFINALPLHTVARRPPQRVAWEAEIHRPR